jgi:multicomponent Na+:H+ antiporter subunit D
MFLAAGAIAHALGSDRIVGISGIAARLPVSTYAFGLAGMSLIGLPPSGGFVAKWLMLTPRSAAGSGGGRSSSSPAGCSPPATSSWCSARSFARRRGHHARGSRRCPRTMEWTAPRAGAARASCSACGAVEPLALLDVGSPFPRCPEEGERWTRLLAARARAAHLAG